MLKTERRGRSASFTYNDGSAATVRAGLLGLGSREGSRNLFGLAQDPGSPQVKRKVNEYAAPKKPEPKTESERMRLSKLADMTSKFHLTDSNLLHIEKRMLDEVNRGLAKATNPGAAVKSFCTYVTELPTGRESGSFLALDLGGTNFRVILVELEAGTRSVKMKSSKHEVTSANHGGFQSYVVQNAQWS